MKADETLEKDMTSIEALLKNRQRELALGALVLVSLAALYLRWRSGARSWLWYDEYYTAVFATSQGDLAREAISSFDFHPPLYYMQLRWWSAASHDEGWMLLNSFGWSIISLVGAFFAGRTLSGYAGGICSVALLGLLPLAVEEAGELRMYAMLIGLSPWAVWAVLNQIRSDSSWRWILPSCALGTAIVWSHGAGLLWLGVWGLLILGHVLTGTDSHRSLRGSFLSLGACAVFSTPPLLDAIKRRPGHLSNSDTTEWNELVAKLIPGSGDDPTLVLSAVLVLGVLLLVFERRTHATLATLLVSVGSFFGGLWVLGTEFPVVHIRTVLFLAPITCVAIGSTIGASLMSNRPASVWPSLVLLVVILAHSGVATAKQLEKVERSAENHRLAANLAKMLKKDEPVWAPRVGTAYSLCWELAPERAAIDPLAPLSCKSADGNPIYTGSQHPRELRTPYRLVLRRGERMPRLGGGEAASKPKKVSGHQVIRVSPR